MVEVDRILERILEGLTPKERKVLDLLELSNAEIAKALDCKSSTISQNLYIIYDKFGFLINFKGRNKRAALILAWQKIRERNEVKPVSQ